MRTKLILPLRQQWRSFKPLAMFLVLNLCFAILTSAQNLCSDLDSDDVCNDDDYCPLDPDNDSDSDQICGDVDSCPTDSGNDVDGDALCAPDDICPTQYFNDADSDSICFGIDICPNDAQNDADSDTLCGPVDSCPNDSLNDIDSDGQCSTVDVCPYTALDDCDKTWFWLGPVIAVGSLTLVLGIVACVHSHCQHSKMQHAAEKQRTVDVREVAIELNMATIERKYEAKCRLAEERHLAETTKPLQRYIAAGLREFFRLHNPARLPDVTQLAAHYVTAQGGLSRLYDKLKERYNAAPRILLQSDLVEEHVVSAEQAAQKLEVVLRRFLTDYGPAMLPRTNDIAFILQVNEKAISQRQIIKSLLETNADGVSKDDGASNDNDDDSLGLGASSQKLVRQMSAEYQGRLGTLNHDALRLLLFSFFFSMNPFELKRVPALLKVYRKRNDGVDEHRRTRLFGKILEKYSCVPNMAVLDKQPVSPSSRLLNFYLFKPL